MVRSRLCPPPTSLRTFSPGRTPWRKGPHRRHILTQNRSRAPHKSSIISAAWALLARISPGHDGRVVVCDACLKCWWAENRSLYPVRYTASLSRPLQASVTLRCNVDSGRSLSGRSDGVDNGTPRSPRDDRRPRAGSLWAHRLLNLIGHVRPPWAMPTSMPFSHFRS